MPIMKQTIMRMAEAIGTTYMCESLFSKLKIVKYKYWKWVDRRKHKHEKPAT